MNQKRKKVRKRNEREEKVFNNYCTTIHVHFQTERVVGLKGVARFFTIGALSAKIYTTS